MTNNVETALSYLSQIRKVYAERLNIKFQEENFSPNEISVLILLSNNKSINTSSQLTHNPWRIEKPCQQEPCRS